MKSSQDLKKSKYYSVTVDFTPDETHMDQLTIVLRYMEGVNPIERFLTLIHFIPNCGHIGIEIANALLQILEHYNIDIRNCRNQSYDNAANMSGKYQGVQALIKNKNNFAVFVPCVRHSLNLVGKTAHFFVAQGSHIPKSDLGYIQYFIENSVYNNNV